MITIANEVVGNLAVRVSMDSTGFQNGISHLNRQLKVVQSEFKVASTSAGSFGNSTEQLRIRAESLNRQIQIQSQRVQTLQQAYERNVQATGENSRASQELAIRVNQAQAALNRMQHELNQTNEQISQQSNRWLQLQRSLNSVSSRLSSVGKKMSEVGKSLTSFVTLPLVGIGTAAGKSALDFEDGMAKVATIADTTAVPIDKLKKSVLELSDQTGASTSDLNEALYQTISATNNTANAMDYTGVAAKAAIGGFTDTATAVDGLTTVLNAYGLKGKQAIQEVSDQMLTAQNFGKTTFGDMAGSIGNVIPIASSLNISTKELFASIATLTKNGIGTSEAITGLKAAYSNILKPQSQAADLAEKLGINFNAAELKAKGWAGFLDEVKAKTGGNTEQMATLFGSVEALNSVMVLAGKGSADFKNALEAMDKAAGATDAAFNKMNETDGAKLRKTFNDLKNAGIELGEALTPMVGKVAGVIKTLADRFKNLTPAQQELIVKIGLIVAAVGPALLILGKLITAVSTIAGAFSAASGAIAAAGGVIAVITGPIGITIAVVAALAAGAVLLIKNWEPIEEFFGNLWNSIVQNTVKTFDSLKSGVANSVSGVKTAVVNGISGALNWVKGLPSQMYTWGVDMIEGLIKGIKAMVTKVRNAVSSVADTIRSFLHFSTPDEGPLANYETWMPDFMAGLAEGIERNKGIVKKAISGLSSDMNLTMNPQFTSATTPKGSVSSSTSYGSLLHADKIVISKDMDIRDLAYKLEFYRGQAAKARGAT